MHCDPVPEFPRCNRGHLMVVSFFSRESLKITFYPGCSFLVCMEDRDH